MKCSCIRTTNKRGVLPGKQKVYRCTNQAERVMRVHQDSEHARVGTGWFEVALCHGCFLTRSEPSAIINMDGPQPWRWLR